MNIYRIEWFLFVYEKLLMKPPEALNICVFYLEIGLILSKIQLSIYSIT